MKTKTNEDLSTTIMIKKNFSTYYLRLKSSGNMITFSLNYDSKTYEKKTSLYDIKNSESKYVFKSYSSKEFFELLSNLCQKG